MPGPSAAVSIQLLVTCLPQCCHASKLHCTLVRVPFHFEWHLHTVQICCYKSLCNHRKSPCVKLFTQNKLLFVRQVSRNAVCYDWSMTIVAKQHCVQVTLKINETRTSLLQNHCNSTLDLQSLVVNWALPPYGKSRSNNIYETLYTTQKVVNAWHKIYQV